MAVVLQRPLGGFGGLARVVDAQDTVTWLLAVVRGGVEAHLVAVRVVQVWQDPADRREMHSGVRLAEGSKAGGEGFDGFLGRDADGEVVEACRSFGARRVEAQPELRAAVR